MDVSSNTIYKLVRLLLQDDVLLSSSGPREREGCLVLSLFEAAKFFNNEEIEDKAIALLQNAVDLPLDTIDYQYGVGGLGHALLYLTDNKLVDADFHTFFGAQQNQIISAIQESDDTSFLLDTVPYLIEYQKVFGEKRVQTAINQVVNDSFGFILNIFDNWDSETQKEDRITFFRFLLKTVYLQKVRLPDIDLDVNVLNKTLSVWKQLYEGHKIRHSHAVSFYINQLSGWSTSDVNQLFRPIDLVTTSVLDLPSVIQLNTMQLLSNKFDWQNNPMNRLSDINVLELFINKMR